MYMILFNPTNILKYLTEDGIFRSDNKMNSIIMNVYDDHHKIIILERW